MYSGSSLVLASGSPRRKELLANIGIPFDVCVSHVEEEEQVGESPEAMVRRLACDKAAFVSKNFPSRWVIGADTTVYCEGRILGKPRDEEEAFEMLKFLQGKVQQVWSAFALLHQEKGVQRIEAYVATVTFTEVSDALIRAYIKTGEPMDKAGAYGVQGIGSQFIERIDGSFTTVVGLPLSQFVRALLEEKAVTLR